MTKKDYELIASTIKNIDIDKGLHDLGINFIKDDIDILNDRIANIFCFTLASKNPRFNKEKFLQACGVEIAQCN